MNITNVSLYAGFENTVPVALPTNLQIDVSQLIGIVPIEKGGTGANNRYAAGQNLDFVRRNSSHTDLATNYNNRMYGELVIQSLDTDVTCWVLGYSANQVGHVKFGDTVGAELGVTGWAGYPANSWNFSNYTALHLWLNNSGVGRLKEHRVQVDIDTIYYNLFGDHNVNYANLITAADADIANSCFILETA